MKMLITLNTRLTPDKVSAGDLQNLLNKYGDLEDVSFDNPGSPEYMAREKAVQLLQSIRGETSVARIHEVAQACQILLTLARGK